MWSTRGTPSTGSRGSLRGKLTFRRGRWRKLCSSIKYADQEHEHGQRAWNKPTCDLIFSGEEVISLSLSFSLSLSSFLSSFSLCLLVKQHGMKVECSATTHSAFRCPRSFAHSHLHHLLSLFSSLSPPPPPSCFPAVLPAFSNFRDEFAHSHLHYFFSHTRRRTQNS